MELKKIFKIVLILGIILILFDQTGKILVNCFVEKDISIIPNDILSVTKVNNEGIAFGLNKQNLINIFLSIIVLIFVFNYIIKQKERMTNLIIVYLTLIISGGISNVLDRIFKGAVFDFIKIGDFPVFNFADMFIVIGWVLFLINFIKETMIDIKIAQSRRK